MDVGDAFRRRGDGGRVIGEAVRHVELGAAQRSAAAQGEPFGFWSIETAYPSIPEIGSGGAGCSRWIGTAVPAATDSAAAIETGGGRVGS